jgi:putative FmdB family regulatory protein
MPLYEYLCTSCGHRFERIQKFSDPLVTTCPQCGGPVEKQISSPAIQFKGAGWYVNDYAKSGKTDSTTKPASTGESGKTDASKTEAKPATPPAKPSSDKT